MGLGNSDVGLGVGFTVYSERALPLEQFFPKRPFGRSGCVAFQVTCARSSTCIFNIPVAAVCLFCLYCAALSGKEK